MKKWKRNKWAKFCSEMWDLNDCEGGTVGKTQARIAFDCLAKHPDLQAKLADIKLDTMHAYMHNWLRFNGVNMIYLIRKA